MSANFWASSHREQWMFSKKELLRQRAEDLKNYSEEEYAKFMIFWPNFIQHLVQDAANQGHPKIRMQVIGTATVFFKRFFIRRAFKDIDPFALCCVCVLLASKAEEHGQVSVTKLSQLVPSVLKKYYNATYELKSPIPYDIEFIIVETMDCCLIVFQPYRPLITYLQDLEKEHPFKDFEDFRAQAWKVVNDSFRTDCNFLYPPHIIAIGSIIVGASLMDKDQFLKNWMSELSIDGDQLFECVKTIVNMYRMWRDFNEKEQTQALIDKLPKVNGDPIQAWGRPGSQISVLDNPRPPVQQQSNNNNQFYMGGYGQQSNNMGQAGMNMGMGPMGGMPMGHMPGPSGIPGQMPPPAMGAHPGYRQYGGYPPPQYGFPQ